MTSRRWAPILVRTLFILGGAGILLVLGAAAAGAAEAPAPVGRSVPLAPPAPSRPTPAPIQVAVPLPPAPPPADSAVPSVSVHLPAVTAGLGGDGMTVGVDPASLGDVPPSPGDAGSGAEPAAAARGEPGADLDARTAPARRPGPAGAAPIGAATARPAPAPISPPGAPLTSFALALVGLATGAEVTSRRTGAPHAGVLGAARALRNRLLLGVLRNVVPGGSPPGFAVLLARPG